MEQNKQVKQQKKGINWEALFSFGAEIAKMALVAGLTTYVAESVKTSMNRRRDESAGNVIDFQARKAA
jgi:ribosomal protein L18